MKFVELGSTGFALIIFIFKLFICCDLLVIESLFFLSGNSLVSVLIQTQTSQQF